jgi:hypothetical protein
MTAKSYIWFRQNGGIWNNNSSANPTTLVGGIDISATLGDTMYPTAGGTGDISQTFNFGASSFAYSVPAGYTAGWPHSGGGFTTFDPSTIQGSVSLSGGNLSVANPVTNGLVQTLDGYNSGNYYFESKVVGGDIFSQEAQSGVGRLGVSIAEWVQGGFSGGDNIGGANCVGGADFNSYVANIWAFTVLQIATPFDYGPHIPNIVLSIAVALNVAPPAPTDLTLADLWFGPTSGFVDFTAASNRRNFISYNGGAQNLGANGQNPFQVSPPVFLTRTSAIADTFAANNGRGGQFFVSGGSLADGATNPPGTTSSTQSFTPYPSGQGVLGDYLTGNLYQFNPAQLLDNGTKRKWVRRWRALPKATMTAVKFNYLAVSMETGIGMADGFTPQLVLRWSDDGGWTFSDPRIIPVGAKGQTAFTIKANRLGMTRRWAGSDRIFELSSTDPFVVAILDAEVDAA